MQLAPGTACLNCGNLTLVSVEVLRKAEAEPSPAKVEPSAAKAEPSDITDVKGIGPMTAKELAEAGVVTLEDLAGLTDDAVDALDADDDIKARIKTNWREQAVALTIG